MNWAWWCIAVIQAKWEAEVEGLWSETSPGQKYMTLSQKTNWAWWCMPVIPVKVEDRIRRIVV
jgi:hypothetical protein